MVPTKTEEPPPPSSRLTFRALPAQRQDLLPRKQAEKVASTVGTHCPCRRCERVSSSLVVLAVQKQKHIFLRKYSTVRRMDIRPPNTYPH